MNKLQKRSKRHHIVPVTLQKHFTEASGKLWYCHKIQTNKFSKPELRSPRSAFHERNRFTVLLDDGPSDIVETVLFSKMDDILGKLIPQLLSTLERGLVPRLDDGVSQNFKELILSLAKRSPDFMQTETDEELGLLVLKNTLAILPTVPNYLPEVVSVLKRLNDSSLLRQYGRDIRTRGTISEATESNKKLKEYQFRWVSITGKPSFILSSMMVYRLGNGGMNGLANPLTEVWMPLSPKIAAVLLRDPENKIPPIIDPAPKLVRDLNVYSAKNSTMVASHSNTLLSSIINPR